MITHISELMETVNPNAKRINDRHRYWVKKCDVWTRVSKDYFDARSDCALRIDTLVTVHTEKLTRHYKSCYFSIPNAL